MDTRDSLIAAALEVLREGGEAAFSTRAVLAIARVSAPTLYHHFGNADGLLGAAMTEAFVQFRHSKNTLYHDSDPVTALSQGWDEYVDFARVRPRIYAAMLSRVIQGCHIDGALSAFDHLSGQLRAIAAVDRLMLPLEEAADIMWGSANAASLLHVTANLRKAPPPTDCVLGELRNAALKSILCPTTTGDQQ